MNSTDFYLFIFKTQADEWEHSIGQYVLFRTVPWGKQYAAKIVSRSGPNANLIWHAQNVYAPGEAPGSPLFSRATFECSEALEYACVNATSGVSLCQYVFIRSTMTESN